MKIIAGVDLSTKEITTAFVTESGKLLRTDRSSAKGRLAYDRYDSILGLFALMVRESGWVDQWVIEDIPFVKSRNGIVALAQVLGGIRAVLTGRRYEIVPGYDWKKRLGLSGNANKQAIRLWVFDHSPEVSAETLHEWTQDQFDAYAIARSGHAA